MTAEPRPHARPSRPGKPTSRAATRQEQSDLGNAERLVARYGETLRFHMKPSIPRAWKAFASSIAQLGLMLVGAVADRILLG